MTTRRPHTGIHPRTTPPRLPAPCWPTRAFLLLYLAGLCSRGYGDYNQTRLHDPGTWTSILAGTAAAPEQYRIGIVFTADWMSRHLGFTLSRAFGLLDIFFSAVALLLLLHLLERTAIFRRSSRAVQWFGAAAFAAMALYALDWSGWYHRVSTLPTAGLVAVLAWLLAPKSAPASAGKELAFASAALAVAVLQSFVRADIVVALFAGVLIASLLGWGHLSLRRWSAAVLGLLGMLAGAGVQIYLMKVRYPQASYGRVPVIMILHDYRQWAMWMALLIFIAPLLWTLAAAVRQPHAVSGAGPALLIAATGYLGIFVLLGRLDEVRIFLPMSLVILPATVELMMVRLAEPIQEPA